MNLKPIENEELEYVSKWFQDYDNYKWLDFGNGQQKISLPSLKLMTQKDLHEIRIFTDTEKEKTIGVVALSDINRQNQSAVLWYILGDKSFSDKHYTTRAAARMLEIGFSDLELESISAWTVDINKPSIKILINNNFRYIGRCRKCHRLDGELHDRLWFDLLSHEHKKEDVIT